MSFLIPRLSVTQLTPIQDIVVVTSVTSLGISTALSSSLFLNRIFVPGEMFLSEIDVAQAISFNATSNGAGSFSRSMVVYSFGNSTSLASLLSFSVSGTWKTGTITAAGSTSISQYQGGWSGPNIAPMTFASSVLPPGDYVVGQLFNFSAASASWSLSFFGNAGEGTVSATVDAITSLGTQATTFHTLSATSQTTAATYSGKAYTALTATPATGTTSFTYIFTSLPAFGYIGTGSTSTNQSPPFLCGI